MKTVLFVMTGTGNSLWAARTLAARLGAPEPLAMTPRTAVPGDAEAIGLVFPVHIWGLPRRVLEFIAALPSAPGRYHFAVAVNAGGVSRTLIQLRQAIARKGLTLSLGSSLVMPSNYVPWGGPGPEEKLRELFGAAEEKLGEIAEKVSAREKAPMERGPLWQRIVYTLMYQMAYPHIHEMDKDFWVDDKCNRCGVCAAVCPADNIVYQDGRPVWQKRCEQCLACIQWCPKQAIQYGKKTAAYPRYHHPRVTLADARAYAAAARPAGK